MKYQLPQKPHLLKIIPPEEKSIVIKGDEIAWNNPWHFHPEVELLYCIKGKGTNFIGNHISAIEEGELILMGKNLPHTRQRDRRYYDQYPEEKPETIVVQFQEDFLGEKFLEIKEFRPIRSLLTRAVRGLKFTCVTRQKIVDKLYQIREGNPTWCLIEFLHILDLMANSDQYKYLNAEAFYIDSIENEGRFINLIYRFTVDHFHEQIRLEDVAALVNMSVPSLCRNFKSWTRKTYYQYLIELRVGYACKMLMEGNVLVSEACFACGFNNLSNFHKQFKNIMGVTPAAYRKKARLKIPK